ncbi:MAG: hypothetical protein ACM3SS_16070 [Rhodospirillaceae bacterium]
MKTLIALSAAVVMFGAVAPSHADPDKHESGRGRYSDRKPYRGGEYKEEYWDGNCKVERKWEHNGKYKEERKCEGYGRGDRGPGYGGYPPVYQEPGVVVQPPAVVIQPPPVVIR